MTFIPAPDDTLSIALSLARIGWHVFPVKITETPDGRRKKPLIKWKDGATTDPDLIKVWWTADYPGAWIGVNCDRSSLVVVDLDTDNGKDGPGHLAKAKLTLPETFHYTTGRGGTHHVYAAPLGDWTIGQDTPVKNVDIRAGHGLMVYYGPELNKKPHLADAPSWALIPRSSEVRYPDATEAAWREEAKPGKPGAKVRDILRKVKSSGMTHDEMLWVTRKLVKLGTIDQKAGVVEALDAGRALYTRDFPEYGKDWDASVVGTIAYWGLPSDNHLVTIAKKEREQAKPQLVDPPMADAPTESDTPEEATDPDQDDFEEDVESELRKLKVTTQARRRLAAESYTGTEEISWEDLEHHEVRWLVEDLVAEQSLTYLVARANTGKTFTFIDMVARMQAGLPWLGKTTRQAKTLVVLGEGIHGAIDRFRAWSKATGIPLADIQHGIKFAAGANLNNDESLERLQRMAVDCELIVIDTYAATSGIDKEDDAALASLTLNRAKTINPNAALFFTHHPRKLDEDSERPVMRGSGAMAGAADTVMTLYRDHTYIPDGSDNHRWLALSTDAEHAGKNRNAQTETFRGLYLAEVDGSAVLAQVDGEGISKADKVIRSHLTGPMTVIEFAEKSSLSRNTATKYLKESKFASVKKGSGPVADVYSPTSNALLVATRDELKAARDRRLAEA